MPVEVVSRKKSWRILGCKAGDLPCASWFLAHVPEDLKTSTPVFRTPGAATASGNISPILSFVRKAARLASALLWSGCGRRYRHIGGQCDPSAAEAIWERAGLAIPLQVNFALSGAARLIREIRAALQRREREQALACRAASAALENELKSTVAGLLLHSQLALSGGEVPSSVADKLRVVAELANSLRQRLNAPL